MCVCMCIFAKVCVPVHMCVCLYVCVFVYVCVSMHIQVCKCGYVLSLHDWHMDCVNVVGDLHLEGHWNT